MEILIDDLSSQETAVFPDDHIRRMKSVSPPESKHALDLEALRKPEISFWIIRDDIKIIGCGALQGLSPAHGEIKSMRTLPEYKRKDVATSLLTHIIEEAMQRGYLQLSLGTGSMNYFIPARALYSKFGFVYCGPFAFYKEDANSVFMKKVL